MSISFKRLQISRRNRQRDRVTDRLVESIVRSAAEDERLFAIRALIEVVALFMMHRREVVRVHLDAHLDAKVLVVVHVPRAGMAHHIAIPRLDELRPLPERRGQRLKAQRGEEALAILRHLLPCLKLRHRPDLLLQSSLEVVHLVVCPSEPAQRCRRCCPTPAPTYSPAGAPESFRLAAPPPRHTSGSA